MGEKNKQEKDGLLRRIMSSSNFGILIALIVMVIVFTILKPSYFSKNNILNIFVACSIVGLVAIGETFLMIAGQIDMSSGSISAFSGVFIAALLARGWPLFPAFLLTLLAGAAIDAHYQALQGLIAGTMTPEEFAVAMDEAIVAMYAQD